MTAAVVSYPQYSSLVSGERVTVLVDTKQPGYAEFPGVPFKKGRSWILQLVLALASAGAAAFHGRDFLRVRVHRRDQFTPAKAAAGVVSPSA